MTVLTIRAHRRYAVRRTVQITADAAGSAAGLLIELSAEGCRISGLGHAGYGIGDPVQVHLGDRALSGRIRWAHGGVAGIRLDSALRPSQLAELVVLCRRQDDGELRRYGT